MIVVVTISLILLSFISLVLNSLCIHFLRLKRFFNWKPSAILLANLLITHIVQALIVQPMYIGKNFKFRHQFWKRFFKDGFLFSYLISFYGVCFGVLLIALDRFLATYLVTRYKIYVTIKNTVNVIGITWAYICTLCLIPFVPKIKFSTTSLDTMFQNTSSKQSRPNAFFSKDGMNNTLLKDSATLWTHGHFYCPQAEWTAFMLLGNAALPYIIIVFCYLYILHRLKVSEKKTKIHNNNSMGEEVPLRRSTNGADPSCKPSIDVSPPCLQSVRSSSHHSSTFATTKSTFDTASIQSTRVNTQIAKKKKQKIRRKNQANGFDSKNGLTYFTFGLLLIYFLLWTPSVVYYTILRLWPDIFPVGWDNSAPEKRIVFVMKLLSYVCGLLSAVLYTCRNHEMKRFLRATIRTKMRMLSMKNNGRTVNSTINSYPKN